MSEQLDRFISLLKGIFELDKSDLDFGIYRIMNIRKKEIEKFLAEGLPARVKDALAPFAGNTSDIEKRIAEIEKQCDTVGIEVANSKMAGEYNELKATLAKGVDLSGLEADVYSQLYSFFNRYYEEGDFISKRRYKEGVYAIPYEGEEVKLYWANQDQYYIKTSENFKDYTFVAEGYNIHFRLVDATTEQNNNKESKDNKRVFMLYTEDPERPELKTFEFDAEKKELIIRFVFDIPEDKKAKYEELNDKAITTWLIGNCQELVTVLLVNISSDPKKPLNLLQKHLRSYVAKNTFDYFIHKDLKKFLSRELDFFIKNEVMHLDDVDTTDEKRVDTWLAKVRAIKRVGHVIIDFLASIEDFQKKLWLKKKFVVQCDYCITLDRVPEKYWSEIIENEAQIQEWIDMYAIDDISADLEHLSWSNPISPSFLRQNKNLVLDTSFFTTNFKEQLLSDIDQIDSQINGIVINGDNFHAINILKQAFVHKIKYVYIDPPYNAQSSEILYKNSFKHSSWCTLVENRLKLSKALLSNDFVYTVAIDEIENHRLGMMLSDIFSLNTGNTSVSVVINPSGQQGKNFSTTNEHLHFIYTDNNDMLAKEIRDEKNADVRGFMNGAKGAGGNYLRSSGKTCFYPIYVQDNKIIGFGDVSPDSFHPASANIVKNGVTEIYPVDNDGVERKWLFGRDTVEEIKNELSVKINKNSGLLEIIRTKQAINYKTAWNNPMHSAKEYGTGVLTRMFRETPFSFPKSVYAVQECIDISCNHQNDAFILDYFAGAATTAHATILSNICNQENKKFILVEMGTYFKTATLPRVKKVLYASHPKSWSQGKPVIRDNGYSAFVKYFNLESYEDALSNVELPEDKSVERMVSLFGDEYLIKYMLDLDTAGSVLNLAAFNDPFDYKLKVTEKNETKEVNADLMETFNYLIGLTVDKMYARKIFSASPDPAGEYEGAVKLIGNDNGEYIFRQIEGTLPSGERALIIWRNITNNLLESNAALDAYFQRYRINPADREYDVIYVNGDNNIANLKSTEETWKVRMIEPEFKTRMFEEE